MNFVDFIQHQRMLGEYIVSLYLEMEKIALCGVTVEAREKCTKLGSSFTEARKEYLDNERELRRMKKFTYSDYIDALGVCYATKDIERVLNGIGVFVPIEIPRLDIDYLAEVNSLSSSEQCGKNALLFHSQPPDIGITVKLIDALFDFWEEIRRCYFSKIENIDRKFQTLSSQYVRYLDVVGKQDDYTSHYHFLRICYRIVRSGNISRIAPEKVNMKKHVDNVKGSLGTHQKVVEDLEAIERKNENDRLDVPRVEGKITRKIKIEEGLPTRNLQEHKNPVFAPPEEEESETPAKHCISDGHKYKIDTFRLERPGWFRSRGEHNNMGMSKRRIHAEDLSLNHGKDLKISQVSGHRWRRDPDFKWLVDVMGAIT